MSERPVLTDAAGAPTQSLVVGAVGDRCVSCGSPMTSDQRYCVACGERRGRARFPIAELAKPAPQAVSATVLAPPPRRVTWSGGATLVTGIATLLLALGVGVLIGHSGQSNQHAATPSVITVNGGGGTASAPASGSTLSSTSSTGSTGSKKSLKPAKKLPPKTVIVKAQAQAASVLGGKNLPPATVKVGQKGSGPGFSGGKFTGNFFGP